MPTTFSPKEAIAFIAKSIVLATAVAKGIPLEQAELAGGIVEGTITGFSYRSGEKTIYQQLDATIRRSVETMLQAPNYEIPEDCINHLMTVFSVDNAISYLHSSDPLPKIKAAIQLACSQSKNCEVSTLPLDLISENLIRQIYGEIYNNHELSGLITMVQAGEINKKLDSLNSMVKTALADDYSGIDAPTHIEKRSIESAEKCAANFHALLFSEQERLDPMRLCDVYVDSCIVDSAGTEYNSFDGFISAYQNEEVILIEGEAGSGKSSLLMKIADKYLKKEIFQDRTLFFVQGKEIRHSKGKPIDDILKALKLQSPESLDDAVVFLDAYDEISYAAASAEKNQEYLAKLLYGCDGFTLIITVRDDYIKEFNGPRFQLRGFNCEQRGRFLEKYNAHRNEENQLSQEYINCITQEDSYYEDGIYEVLSIPMLLYMIVVREVDISQISDKFDLYELVFARNGRGAMHYRGKEQKAISQKIWEDSYSLALRISKSMFFNNDSFIHESKIRSFIDDMNVSKETKAILKNRFGIEVFLTGSDSSIYTFIHRSIYEYFTAKGICLRLEQIIKQYIHGAMQLPVVIAALNDTFPAEYFNEKILYYVLYAINRGYVIDALSDAESIHRVENLFHELLASQLCTSGTDTVPYIVRLKNMLLWVFNSFSVMFGMLEIDDNAHWVQIDHSVLQYLLRIKEPEDTLLISHCNLRSLFLYKYDLGYVYFIDNELEGAVFREANCKKIISSGQKFHHIDFHSADFWQGNYAGYSFDNSDLRYADCRDSILRGASFRGADLRCGLFANAELYGADFSGAHIYLDDFEDALYDSDAFDKAIIHDPGTDDPDEDILLL